MSTQKGTVAVTWGIDFGATATGMGTFTPQSSDYTLEGDEKKIRGADGITINRTFFDGMEKLQLEVIPTSTTHSTGSTNAQFILPSRGADVTLTSSLDTEITGTGTGDGTGAWIFISGSKKQTVDGEGRLTFNLERGEKNLPTV